MPYFIRYQPISGNKYIDGNAAKGPYETIEAARVAITEDLDWFCNRLACIVEAADHRSALKADPLEFACETPFPEMTRHFK